MLLTDVVMSVSMYLVYAIFVDFVLVYMGIGKRPSASRQAKRFGGKVKILRRLDSPREAPGWLIYEMGALTESELEGLKVQATKKRLAKLLWQHVPKKGYKSSNLKKPDPFGIKELKSPFNWGA